MANTGGTGSGSKPRAAAASRDAANALWAVEHYARIAWHRKWLILGTFVVVSLATFLVARRLPDVFVSDTLILVDPQKVPDSYVKSTVTGEIRNRLSTLSQQILSATRLQKIIETFNLYPEERKSQAREDVITKMRANISVNVVSDFGASQDLQAFRIGFSGKDPRQVAQVANQIASLFIEENLKAREQQATGTSDFLDNRLKEARQTLETQEGRLKDFKLKHLGEMPEQQTATLQVLGQLQSQLQQEGDALSRAEQQKSYLQSMMATASSAPVVELDEPEQRTSTPSTTSSGVAGPTTLTTLKSRLTALQSRYSEKHPDIIRLKRQIQDEEARVEATQSKEVAALPPPETQAPPTVKKSAPPVPVRSVNPVLQSQLKTVEVEIARHKEQQQALAKSVASYRGKLEAIPVREQQMSDLVRDYETSKANYNNLLDKSLSAQSATQLEIRQKGERFSILDPAQPAERPSSPNRKMINTAGSLAGLGLGFILALITEFLGMTITSAEQIVASCGIPVLEVIPNIQTVADRRTRRKRLVWAAASVVVAVLTLGGIVLYRTQLS